MRSWLALLVTLTIVARGTAQTAPFASVADAINALGSRSFPQREKASVFLFAAGQKAEPALEKVLSSKDPEQARRARAILDKFQWGIFPDTPKTLLQQIDKYRSAEKIEDRAAALKGVLLERPHGIRTAVRLIRRADGAEPNILSEELHNAVLDQVPDLLWRKELDALEDLLEACLVAKKDAARRDYAALLLLRGRVQEQIPRWRARAERPDGAEACALLTYLYRIAGDAKNQRWAAEKTGDPATLEVVLHEQSAWADLLTRFDKLTERRKTQAFKATYQRLAGQTKEFDDTIAAILKEALAQPAGDDYPLWQHLKPMLTNARGKEAMQILERGNNYSFAYDLLCQQTRYREAFELADKVRDLPKHSLQIPRARTLHQLGEVEKAHAVLKEYAPAWERRITAKAEEGERKIHYSDLTDLPAAEYKLGMHDEALAHIDKLMLLFPNDAANIISAVLYTDDGRTALWWRVLREQHAKEAVAKSLERLHALKQKRMPAAEFEAMVRTAVPWLKTSKRETDLEPLAGICEDMKRDDLARLCLDKLGDGADQWLPLGHFLLKKKAWDEAAAVFAKVCAKQKDSAEAHFLRGWAMVKAGHEEEGRRWMEIGHWLPLGRDAGHYALALALDQHDLAGEAPRQWDLPRQLGSDDEFFVLHFALTQASRRATRLHKYDEALRLAERSDLGVLYGGISYIDNKSWIAKPHQTLVIRALANIQAHQFDAAQRTIKIASELMPGNVELPLACVPAFQKEGRARDADALFDQCFAHLRQLCKEYPRSGEFNNNVAWLAASCRRQLDPALEHARKAVELAPQNAGFIDTLAEVHFQRGDRKRALELIAQAIAIDPNYNYFRHQQQRFTAGDRAAPIPED